MGDIFKIFTREKMDFDIFLVRQSFAIMTDVPTKVWVNLE